jgi:Tol biopolymer transport system component
MPAGASSSQAPQLTTEGLIGNEISWTKDGQLLISAVGSGLTLVNPNSGAGTPFLSQLPFADFAHTCPDGHVIFTASSRTKIQAHIWRADADGGNAKELTGGKFDYLPVCSADGKSVLFSDADNKLEKVATEGGAAQPMEDLAVFSRIAISPDGKLAAFVTSRMNDPKEKLVLLFLDSSQPPRFLDFERPRVEFIVDISVGNLLFTHDGTGVIYPVREGNTDNLWLQHLDGTPGKLLTDFKSEYIRDFDYSYDGKQLAIIRGHRESDVVLIRDSEK